MKLQESGEMYLEAMLVLSQHKEHVRSIDISEYRNYSKPSVSRAIKLLKENGYINVSPEGYLTRTDKGREVAEKIYEHHVVLTKLLTQIGVDPEIAEDDACRIEHIISDETINAVKRFLKENN